MAIVEPSDQIGMIFENHTDERMSRIGSHYVMSKFP